MPTVSIIVVTRNDADRLEATLASVASQAQVPTNWEIVVADGMSVDRTPAVLDSWARRLPSLRVERQRDSGVYDAMNRAVSVATGRYLLFLNCGDVFASEHALAALVEAATPTDAAWLVFDINHLRGRAVRDRLSTSSFNLYRFLFGRQDYCHQACLFRRDLLLAFGGFDLEYDFMADFDLILKFGIASPPTAVPHCLVDYEGGGISAKRAKEIPSIMHEVRRDRFQLAGLPLFLSHAYAVLQTSRRSGALRRVPPQVRQAKPTASGRAGA